MRHQTRRRSTRALITGAVGAAALTALSFGASAQAAPSTSNDLNFTPLTNNALPCSAAGFPAFANDKHGNPIVPSLLMQRGDVTTTVNPPGGSGTVGGNNDMIALSPDGRFAFTPSESAPSDGITRLTLKGPDTGKKETLAKGPWNDLDGMKWYPPSGMLLASEENDTGGIWQVDPDTGEFQRLDWLGTFAHEGVGLDAAGNLYLGDENRGGAIFKAVPKDVHDLTQPGTLYYLVGTDIDPTGWKQTDATQGNERSEALAGGAILFDRPEDFDEANGLVYFTVTEPQKEADTHFGTFPGTPQVVNRGGVYVLTTTGVPNLSTQSGPNPPYTKLAPMIEVQDPAYDAQHPATAQQGLQYPDNIAFDKLGHLWVHEDIPDTTSANGLDVGKINQPPPAAGRDQQDELYVFVLNAAGTAVVANPDTSGPGVSRGYKAADMRTGAGATACQNEFTGGIFDGQTLYINQQHGSNPTLAARIG